MSQAARRLIEAIQHSLLGSLLVQTIAYPGLWWGFLASAATRDGPYESDGAIVFASMFTLSMLTFFFAWLIGAIARPAFVDRPGEGPPTVPNGFDAWRQLPPGGLRPPAPMRAFVQILGAPVGPVAAVALIALWLVCGLLLIIVAAFPELLADTTSIEPTDVSRIWLAAALALLLTLMNVGLWASQQRRNLAPA